MKRGPGEGLFSYAASSNVVDLLVSTVRIGGIVGSGVGVLGEAGVFVGLAVTIGCVDSVYLFFSTFPFGATRAKKSMIA